MKLFSYAIVLMMMLGLVTVAQAKKAHGAAAGLKGQITAIDGMKVTVSSGHKKNPVTTDVTCDANTTVTRDGQAAKVADLKVGDYVTITPATGTPTTIVASTTAPAKKAK